MTEYPSPAIDDVHLVDLLRALGDPTRLEIVKKLADGEPHPKSEPGWEFDCTKATMAHHWKTLREAGLTRTMVHGRTHDIQLRRTELDAKFPGFLKSVTGQ